MKLVADSGSSKTDWILQLADNKKIEFRTAGLNPYFLSEKEIIKIVSHAKIAQSYFDKVDEIYFFGAGCSSPDKREVVSNALSSIFKNAFISVDSDVVGSAYACCGTEPGISCILGTGSNISYYDGHEVIAGKHGLGFILGDEASGTYFGKKLVTQYLYGIMPSELAKDFQAAYNISKDIVIKNVYEKPYPNTYLASFAPFLSKHSEQDYMKGLIRDGFSEYIETNIKSYNNYRTTACHFVGSIAFHFKDILIECCQAEHVKVGNILKHPIDALYDFICGNEFSNV